MHQDGFSGYHPLVLLCYFALTLFFSMCLMHPLFLAVSLLGALAYHGYLYRRETLRFCLLLLPMLLFATVINGAFHHAGQTILTYLPSGNPLTLESILYGIGAAVMVVTAVLDFSCLTKIMTSDKLMYLFGRVVPALSLVLSMTLRFIPKLRQQAAMVTEAQRCIGKDPTKGSLRQRLGATVAILSILVTWSLENVIETADSMKSRGYGLPGRKSYSIYRLDRRDGRALLWLACCGCYLFAGWIGGGMYWRYFPTMKGGAMGGYTLSLLLVYAALWLTPVVVGQYENRRWQQLESKVPQTDGRWLGV